jgi:hypothetical protein
MNFADEKVVKSHNDVPFYQNLLIKGKREPNLLLGQ